MTKHLDDIRRGLRNPTRYNLAWTAKAEDHAEGAWVEWSEVAPLLDELYVMRNKVEWLRKAEHLVIWDGRAWQVRQEPCHGSIVQDPANRPFPY